MTLRGGTDAAMAPPVGYAQHVLLPLLRRKLGVEVSLDVIRRGFFPKARHRTCRGEWALHCKLASDHRKLASIIGSTHTRQSCGDADLVNRSAIRAHVAQCQKDSLGLHRAAERLCYLQRVFRKAPASRPLT